MNWRKYIPLTRGYFDGKRVEDKNQIIDVLKGNDKNIQKKMETIQEVAMVIEEEVKAIREEEGVIREGIKSAQEELKAIREKVKTIENYGVVLQRILTNAQAGMIESKEAVWAHVFHDTICTSTWLQDKKFSPGRWAVGYQYLYVVYRILDEMRPENILELGLGQSTKLIGEYVKGQDNAKHTVIENNEVWKSFFESTHELAENTKIEILPVAVKSFKDAGEVREYDGFEEKLRGKKFDFISIDAPVSGDMKAFARVDVAKILPDCLEEEFVIVLDDCNRIAEEHTFKMMVEQLETSGKDIAYGYYQGAKKLGIICSSKWKFMCSM